MPRDRIGRSTTLPQQVDRAAESGLAARNVNDPELVEQL
jgi:hypothetical protein